MIRVVFFAVFLTIVGTAAAAVTIRDTDVIVDTGAIYRVVNIDTTLLSYEAETLSDVYAPCFDGTCLRMDAGEWSLIAAGPARIELSGTSVSDTTLRIYGLRPITYQVLGVYATPAYTTGGPAFTVDIPAGAQHIVITPVTAALSGPRLLLDAAWSPADGRISAVIVLQDGTGANMPDQATSLDVELYAPDNMSLGQITMSPAGVGYLGTTDGSFAVISGTYYIFASFNGTSAARAVYVGNVALPKEVDTTLGLISNDTASLTSTTTSAGFVLAPYVFIILACVGLTSVGFKFGAGFSLIAAVIGLVTTLASLEDGHATPLLRGLLGVVTFACLLFAMGQKASASKY